MSDMTDSEVRTAVATAREAHRVEVEGLRAELGGATADVEFWKTPCGHNNDDGSGCATCAENRAPTAAAGTAAPKEKSDGK